MELRIDLQKHRVFIKIRPNAFSLMWDETDVFTFDPAGRLVTAVLDGDTYHRGLDGRVLHKWRERDSGVRKTAWLSRNAARDLVESIYGRVRLVASYPGTQAAEASESLTQLARLGSDALEEDAARFSSIYLPITILPPDQYLALVLQVTEGCHYNGCTFCTFYRDRPFRIKTMPEIRSHIELVRSYFGEGIRLRRSIFLSDANALCIPRRQLLPLLETVNASFAADFASRVPRIHSFVDIFTHEGRTAADYADMRDRNVRRLYLGVETGSRDLLRFLRKPQTPGQVVRTVEAIKQGGVNIGVIVLLGIGGEAYSGPHVEDTARLLNSLPWSEGDLLFLSPLYEFPDMEYTSRAANSGIIALSPARMNAQYAAMRAAVERVGSSPVIAPYNAEQFVY